MAHEVFISYASADKTVADALCVALERQRIRCWIAPRDVIPGRGYGSQILQAIEASKLLVLVFSGNANASQHVMREVERAVNKSVMILPFRIENVTPSADLEYFISTTHWLDAVEPPMERHLDRLVEAVRRNIGQSVVDAPLEGEMQPPIQAGRRQALDENEARQKAAAVEREAQIKAEQEALQRRLNEEAEARRQAEAARQQAEREAQAKVQRQAAEAAQRREREQRAKREREEAECRERDAAAAVERTKPPTSDQKKSEETPLASVPPVANYRPFLMIGIPLVVVMGLYGIFRGGDKPAPAPLPEKIAESAAAKAAAAGKNGQLFASGSKDCEVCPEMVVIPAGSYTMGANDISEDEKPPHPVTVPQQFAAGRFEITFDEWDACVRERGCAHNPGDQGWGRGKRPVINVSWNDARQYTLWLSTKTGKTYRLLSEAEWEYLARAGTTTPFYTGTSINPKQANYDTSQSFGGSATVPSKQQTAPVGSYDPNKFGLYDMHGNVWEWTEDCWNVNYKGAPTQGEAWTAGDCGRRVLRGGS